MIVDTPRRTEYLKELAARAKWKWRTDISRPASRNWRKLCLRTLNMGGLNRGKDLPHFYLLNY
ncbi:hypothetical protein CSV79_12225 [Sporosarcina sp. P13]|nr:hypothetical protein CSV79_12225 [Sporosarcina sp. P13]